MRKPLSHIRAAALASAAVFAAILQAYAAPKPSPDIAPARHDLVLVQDARIIHRDRSHADGAWKKRRHNDSGWRKEHRRDAGDRQRGRDRLGGPYRPRATPKFAYGADGNLRIYDGRRRDDRGWDHRDGWGHGDDWNRKRKRPYITRMNSFGVQDPSLELRDILTAVPRPGSAAE